VCLGVAVFPARAGRSGLLDPDLVVAVEKLVGAVVAGGEPLVVLEGRALRGQLLGQRQRRLHVVVIARPARERPAPWG